MNRTIAQESDDDQFENDSLENDFQDCEFDVDEVPESPLQPNNSAIDEEAEQDDDDGDHDDDLRPRLKKKCRIDSWFGEKTTTCNLPNGIKVYGDNGKIIDIRDKISASKSGKKFNNDFGKMKFKDFKEAKKRFSTITANDHKTYPNLNITNSPNFDSGVYESIAHKMKSVKQVFSILLDKIEESENNEKIDFPFQGLCSTTTSKNTLHTTEMDKDSIENCSTEIMDSDLDEQPEPSQLVNTRMSKPYDSAAAILADATTMEDDSLNSASDSGDDHQKPKKINNNNHKEVEPNESPEMKFVVYQNNRRNNIQNTTATLPVFAGNSAYCERLFKKLCQHCQTYYSERKLTQVEIHGLLERCAKHRGYRTQYRSPPRFWETDFHSDHDE